MKYTKSVFNRKLVSQNLRICGTDSLQTWLQYNNVFRSTRGEHLEKIQEN